MNIKSFIKTQTFAKLPLGIREHDVFSKINKIEKPFKEMGLPNTLSEQPIHYEPNYPDYRNYRIGFTASGAQGAWDIATMSMRGAMSCMHWENNQSCHLIGSVIDPFLGIIYLTDGTTTPYGISFKRRCLVRIIYRRSIGRLALLLERSYYDTGNIIPTRYLNTDPTERYTTELFKKFLQEKTNNRYNVYPSCEREYYDSIPYSTGIKYISRQQQSMSDCGLTYQTIAEHSMPAQDADLISKYTDQN